jgi:hypothetical protein
VSLSDAKTTKSSRDTWIVLLVILLLRVPFILIHHLQEDAFITFRTARNLAEHGDFSFNLHQHFPGTTSLLYTLIIAALDIAFRSHMVVAVQIVGTLCTTAACYLAAKSTTRSGGARLAVWALLACWPVSLLVSYTGMETPLLLLALSGCILALREDGHDVMFFACMMTLPLIRPDAIAYALVFCSAMWILDKRVAVKGAAALGTGCGVFLLVNRLTTGLWLPTTSRAKEIAYHPDHSLSAVLNRIIDIFFHQSFLLPVSTTYLATFSPWMLFLVISAFVLVFRRCEDRRAYVLTGALALLIIAVPVAYATGGVIFDWYLHPASWIATLVVISAGVHIAESPALRGGWRNAAWFSAGILWIGLCGVQWARSLAASTEDYHYRGDIGRYLGDVSKGQGTLFLEPAGYIPTYSGLRTDDEVGLVSNRITNYMLRDPQPSKGAWWMAYVKAEKPAYIVQREPFLHFETFEGYTLTQAEQQWFSEHYQLIRRTHYEPRVYHPSQYLRKILALGSMPDYLVYERTDVLKAQQGATDKASSSPTPISQSR